MKFRFQRKYFSIPYVIFLALFVVVPICLIIFYAFTNSNGQFSLDAGAKFFSDVSNLNVILVSLFLAVQTTLICLIIGYPIAYLLASKNYNKNAVLVMLFIMPMWINFVLRTTATLFSLVDGKVKFERLDAKRQKVSVYPEEAN